MGQGASRRVVEGMVMRAIVLALMLSACAGKPQIVEVPVPVKMTPPPVLARPSLPIATPPLTPGEQIGAWAATVEILQNYATELEALLDGYR